MTEHNIALQFLKLFVLHGFDFVVDRVQRLLEYTYKYTFFCHTEKRQITFTILLYANRGKKVESFKVKDIVNDTSFFCGGYLAF